MARTADIQYIRFSVDGNAARKMNTEPAPFQQAVFSKVYKQKRKCIYVDPVATFGIIVAISMLIMMAVGLMQLRAEQENLSRMQAYVQQLQEENEVLEQSYLESYDRAEVERTALALGMIPKEQAKTVSLSVTVPQQPQTVSLWDRIGTFLTGLFA